MGGLYLIIKKYIDIQQGMEFRCFIKNKKLIAICQRNVNEYFEYLNENSFKADVQEKI